MNYVEQLLKTDAKTARELETGVFQSRRLAKLIGADTETVPVEIRAVKSRRLSDIVSYQVSNKGNFDYSKSFDAKLMLITEGVTNPDLMNKDLQAHFECKSAKDLAEVLFGQEATELSDEITRISEAKPEDGTDPEEEIKN